MRESDLPSSKRTAAAALSQRSDQRPIVTYSHGKSGTTSLYRSLLAQSERPVVRVHMLASQRVSQKAEARRARGLKLGRSLRNSLQYLERPELLRGAQFVTLVRDPLASSVSSFFYGLARRGDEMLASCIDSGDPSPLIVRYHLNVEAIERQYLRWFEEELGGVLGVDLFGRSFDTERGHQVYSGEFAGDGFQLLVVKLRCDDREIEAAVGGFVGLERFRLIRRNTAGEKPYARVYDAFRQSLEVDPGTLERIFGHRAVRHFHSDREIDEMMSFWGGRTTDAASQADVGTGSVRRNEGTSRRDGG